MSGCFHHSRLIVIFAFVALSQFALKDSYGAEKLPGPIKAQLVRVLDGDTFELMIQIWIDQHIQTKLRLNGVDTPEIKGKCDKEIKLAHNARETAKKWLEDEAFILKNVSYGKYAGRVLGDIERSNGESLSQLLINQGLARPYKGGKRSSWCG